MFFAQAGWNALMLTDIRKKETMRQ